MRLTGVIVIVVSLSVKREGGQRDYCLSFSRA